MHFGVVDNEAYGDIGNRFSVEAYPTVLIYRSDKSMHSPIKYSGPRTTEGLIEFLMQQVNEYIASNGEKEVSSILMKNYFILFFAYLLLS